MDAAHLLLKESKENAIVKEAANMKNRHITAQLGGKREMAKYIVDDIAFRDAMWKLYASSDSVRVALQALIKIGERIEDNASE